MDILSTSLKRKKVARENKNAAFGCRENQRTISRANTWFEICRLLFRAEQGFWNKKTQRVGVLLREKETNTRNQLLLGPNELMIPFTTGPITRPISPFAAESRFTRPLLSKQGFNKTLQSLFFFSFNSKYLL
jgi:hypothetical protein